MKKRNKPSEANSSPKPHRSRTIPVAVLLLFVVLLSAGSGIYAGASFVAQQAPNVTVTTTIFTTTTSWTTSTIWSTVTEVVQGILTTIEYTTSTSTATVTGIPTPSNYGDTNIESTNRGESANYVRAATPFTIAAPTTITQFALYFYASPSGHIRFAIYPDGGGSPAGQTLVGQTNGYAIGSGAGWHTYALTTDTIQIPSAGTYWLCYLMDATNSAHLRSQGPGTGIEYFFVGNYASGYPATFPSSPRSINYGKFSFYATGSP